MMGKLFSPNRIVIAAISLTFGALLNGGAHAITDTVFKYDFAPVLDGLIGRRLLLASARAV
jgi:hypothetical protein